jgi:hypothetical protein
LSFILALNAGCSVKNIPAVGLDDVEFRVHPYVSYSNGDYYLVYQVNKGERASVRIVIGEKKMNNKFYYFIIGKTSFPEYDHIVRRPISKSEEIVRLFKADSVFWLNPDKSEVKLKIVNE